LAPEIVVVALFDHGREGYLAAPIVRDVLKAYFDKKTRLEALRQQQSSVTARLSDELRLGIPGPAAAAAQSDH
jgi:penicillin-binding protein 2